MEDSELIEELMQKVREAEELLQRRKAALAALRGKSGKRDKGRTFRPESIPALAHSALKISKQLSLEDLAKAIGKDARTVSLALSRYVRQGRYFALNDGKYILK